MNICKYCLIPLENVSKCSACKSAKYCSIKCQRLDWKDHKQECFKMGQIEMSNKAEEVVLSNECFMKIVQYLHHNRIPEKEIKNKLVLCLVSPMFNKSNKVEAYRCVLNIVPIKEFSDDIKSNIIRSKRAFYLMYHDPLHNSDNSSSGSITSFNFNYEKRDMMAYETIRMLELPAEFTIYEDGRCE